MARMVMAKSAAGCSARKMVVALLHCLSSSERKEEAVVVTRDGKGCVCAARKGMG